MRTEIEKATRLISMSFWNINKLIELKEAGYKDYIKKAILAIESTIKEIENNINTVSYHGDFKSATDAFILKSKEELAKVRQLIENKD